MQKCFHRLVITIFSLLSISCSQKTPPVFETIEPVEVSHQSVEFSNEEQNLPSYLSDFISWHDAMKQPLHSFSASCKDCPASVAQILIHDTSTERNQVGRCFGSLVKEDLVLTSRHCLSASLLSGNTNCEDSIQILFSGNENLHAISSRCLEVSDFIPEPQWAIEQKQKNPEGGNLPHPDWVLLRIKDKMPERVPEIQTEGIADGQKLFLYFPSFDKMEGQVNVKKIACESIQNTPFFPFYIDDKSPMASLRCDEQITSGASGSNLYAEDGRIAGTLSHGLAYIPKGKKRKFKIKGESKYSPWIAINNISCILDMADEDKEVCTFSPGKKGKSHQGIFLKHLEAAKEQARLSFEKWKESSNSPIEWTMLNSENLSSAPKQFQNIFSRRSKKRKMWLSEEGNMALTQLFLPAFPKCLKSSHKIGPIPYPIAQIKIKRTRLRRIKIEVDFTSTTGVLFKKNSTHWGHRFHRKKGRPRHHRSEGEFFNPGNPPLPGTSISLCK